MLLLDHLGVDRAAVLAYSGGIASALELALRHPDRVVGLILANARLFGRVIGTGTLLDTTRFRSLLAERLGGVTPDQVYVYMLGEHGDSQAPVTSIGTVAGMPLRQYPGFSEAALAEVIEATKYGGAEVIKRKRGTTQSSFDSLGPSNVINTTG